MVAAVNGRQRCLPADGLTKPEIDDVLFDYGLAESQHTEDAGGFNNLNLIVEVDGDRFFLKRIDTSHPLEVTDERLRFKHGLIQHLISRGFATPRLLSTAAGETWLQRGSQVFELYEFAGRSQPFSYDSLAQLRNLGAMIAHFQLLADSYPSVSGGAEMGVQATDAQLCELFDAAAREATDDLPEADVARSFEYVRSRYLEASAGVRGSDLPTTIIHGDLTPRNVLFRNDEVTNLVDFDFVRRDDAIIDLAVGLIKLTAPNLELENFETSRSPARAARIDLPRAKVFVDGYRSVKSLEAAEVEALPDYLTKTWVERAAWLSHFFTPGSQLGVLRELARSLEWLESTADELVEELALPCA